MRLVWVLDARPADAEVQLADRATSHGRRLGKPDLFSDELAVVGEFDGAEHRDAHVRRSDVARR